MKIMITLVSVSLLVACGDEPESSVVNNNSNKVSNNVIVTLPSTYAFESRFESGSSAVSYSGQTFRHLLISDLATYISGLGEKIDSEQFSPTADGSVVQALDAYFRFDSTASGAENFLFPSTLATKQSTYDDISSDKNLVGKLAGNDSATDHKDWSTEFKGWSDITLSANGGSNSSPEGLIIAMFETLEQQAIDRVNGIIPEGPDGVKLPVHITPGGLDLQQLIDKVLLMGITFSQAADDYLDDDVEGKGLLASNAQSDDKPYSSLEHAWDEGFGYFGAAIDYLDYSDDQIAAKESIDTNKDAAIDLKSEKNWGASVNAGKRDKGSTTGTDFTKEIMDAFLGGRTLIANASDTLTEAELSQLKAFRDTAILGWEKAIAATIIHYINDNITLIGLYGTDEYDFLEHAKVWSEVKGFSLGLQFNPRSPMKAEFENFHVLIGDLAPKSSDDLLQARTLLQNAYGFDPQDVANW